MIQGIGHIGIFVEDIAASLEGICRLLGTQVPPVTDKQDWKMKVALVEAGPVQLELVEDYGKTSWIADLVKERGTHIHHFCLISDDLDNDIANLASQGVKMKMDSPTVGLRGKRIIFTDPETNGGIPVELSEP
jgi:methylmalonyl-CoA epimerase